jgi:uncharacterized protein (DUF1015 family)
MVIIKPFKGWTYDPGKVNIQEVVTEPYDKISSELQETYYERSPFNAVRLVLGKQEASDNEQNNRYTRAKELLEEWKQSGVFVQSREPQLYAYYQEYYVNGQKKIRKGLVTLVKLEDLQSGIIRPHERTLAGPKKDRLELFRATRMHLEHIFMLYSDPALGINALLDKVIAKQKPLFQVKDEYGSTHKLWPLTDKRTIDTIVATMQDKSLLIADGHHRYETACNLSKENGAWGSEDNPFNFQMMTLVNMDDEGLTVLPTHRLLHGLAGLKKENLLRDLAVYYEVEKHPSWERLSQEQAKATTENPRLGLYIAGEYYLLTLKDLAVMDAVVTDGHSSDWKHLDVSILHSLVLEKILGITLEKQSQQSNITYVRYAEDGIKAVDSGKEQMAFFLNPTGVHQVQRVAEHGEVMPQKSTDFFPKLLTGLVFQQIE